MSQAELVVAAERAFAVTTTTRRSETAKRALDVLLAVPLLLLLVPVLLCVGLFVRACSPGPPLFRQLRVGRDGRVYPMLKFRTMACGSGETEPAVWSANGDRKRPGDPRTTRGGRFLRETSLDELPQLWNVLRGEMSLVGPRPLPVAEHVGRGVLLGPRLTVRPGLTGPWQVSGRSTIPFTRRVAIDDDYALTRTLAGDLRLLARTVPAVLTRRGAY